MKGVKKGKKKIYNMKTKKSYSLDDIEMLSKSRNVIVKYALIIMIYLLIPLINLSMIIYLLFKL